MDLRHLRYFIAVVQWSGYREASRHLFIAQPAISAAVSDLEQELGINLFSRQGRTVRLTPEGQVFYDEALKTLAQAENSIAVAQRAAKGEIGRLGIGFIGFATQSFLPGLLRAYKTRHPGISLRLEENVPSALAAAFDRGEVDIAFTRPPSNDRRSGYESRLLCREPLVVALPKTREVKAKRIRIADLAGERIVTFQRASSPEVFDTIVRICNDSGFSPKLHNELNNMHSVLSTVEAGEGVAIVSASARNLRAESVSFYRLQPDTVRVDIVAVWRKENRSVPLRLFVELLDQELPAIRRNMRDLER